MDRAFNSREQPMHDLLLAAPGWEHAEGVNPPSEEYYALLRNLSHALDGRRVERTLIHQQRSWGVCEITILTDLTWVFSDFKAGTAEFELSVVARSSLLKVSPGGGMFSPEEGVTADNMKSLILKFKGGKFVRTWEPDWNSETWDLPYGDIDDLTFTAMQDLARISILRG